MKKTVAKKKLSLNKDTLRKLTETDLKQVQGAGTQARVCTTGISTSPPKYLC